MSQSYVPPFALPAVLALLGSAALVAALSLAAGGAFVFGRRRLAAILGASSGGVAVLYAAALLTLSFTAEEKTLGPGDRKSFCEIDCHLAYSLRGCTARRAGAAVRYVVSIQTWFDPSTVAPFRGNAPLTPNPREVFVVDASGRRYGTSPASITAPENEAGEPSTPLTRELRPGERYVTRLAFDLPRDARAPRLFLGDPPGVESLLLGHENSPFHPKIYFALEPPSLTGDRSLEGPLRSCRSPGRASPGTAGGNPRRARRSKPARSR